MNGLLLVFAVFAVPLASLIRIEGTIVWYPQLLCFLSLGFTALSTLFWKFNKPLAAFTFYCLLSYLFVCHASPRAFLLLTCVYSGAIVAYIASNIPNPNWIYKSILAFAGVQCAYVLLQAINIDPVFHMINENKSDVVGFVGSHNQLGVYYALITPILISFNLWLGALALIPIVLVKCSSALVGAMFGVFTWLFLSCRVKTLAIVLLVSICSLFIWFRYDTIFNGTTKERGALWGLTLKQSLEGKADIRVSEQIHHIVTWNPLFGAGLGNFFIYSPGSQYQALDNQDGPKYEHAHFDLLEAFFELGYVGVLLILLIIFKVIADALNNIHLIHPDTRRLFITFSSLVALSVTSCGVYVFHAPVSLFMACLMFGLFYREINYAGKHC